MNEENEWGQNVKAELVEGPVGRVCREEVVEAIRDMKVGKAAGPLEVSAEMIAASGEIGIGVMVVLCQGVLDGRGIPDDWAPSVVVPILRGRGDAMNCIAYKGVKLLEHAIEDSRKGAREEIATYGESGRDAIWFCARQRNDRRTVHSEKAARRILRQGEIVYVLR